MQTHLSRLPGLPETSPFPGNTRTAGSHPSNPAAVRRSWDFVIAYRKDSYLSSAARNFIDITKSAFAGPPDEA